MKNFQNIILFIALIALLAYNIWDKLEERKELNIAYEAEKELLNISLPDAIDFCGEPVPLKEPDIREHLDEELHQTIQARFGVQLIMKRANRWFPQIEPILEQEGIPNDFKYLAIIESALSNKVSPAGAVGFWQIMTSTALEFGLEVNEEVDERYDPIKATRAACKYLRQAHSVFNDWTLVAASYNRGITGIQRALEDQEVRSYYDLYLNQETAEYVYRLLAFKEVFTHPDEYKLTVPKRNLYYPEAEEYVEVTSDITDLVAFAQQHGVSYKQLRERNPWLVGKSLTVTGKNKTYRLVIPERTDSENLKIDTEISQPITDSVAD